MLNMQNVKDIEITEGNVRTIHDKDNKLIWGRLAYDTKYAGDTEQQTYTGKNLFDISKVVSNDSSTSKVINNGDGTLFIQTPSTSSSAAALSPNKLSDYCPNLKVDDIATLSFDTTGSEKYIYLYGTGANFLWGTSTSGRTKTVTQAMLDAQVLFYASGSSTTATISNFQIELGSTPTDYEPYVGGIPSPNPDYPQAINVVTGTQTVTINDGVDSEDYTISLGTTELCKIDTYQDYIYKSGDDWYVYKTVGKVELDGSNDETWAISNSGTPNFFYRFQYLLDAKTPAEGFSNIAIQTGINSSNTAQGFDYTSGGELRIRCGEQKTVPEWRSFLSTTPMVLYYPLDTPTDTQITDTTLIGQLDAIHQFLTRYGYNSNVTGNLPIIINKTNL